jgi:hypothetical protein
MIFCVAKSTGQQEEIIICIRKPFVEIEKYLKEGFDDDLDSHHLLSETMSQGVLQDPGIPTSLSEDLFLLPFSDLNLDSFFTDLQRAGSNLYLPPDKFYPCILEHFRRLILVKESNPMSALCVQVILMFMTLMEPPNTDGKKICVQNCSKLASAICCEIHASAIAGRRIVVPTPMRKPH